MRKTILVTALALSVSFLSLALEVSIIHARNADPPIPGVSTPGEKLEALPVNNNIILKAKFIRKTKGSKYKPDLSRGFGFHYAEEYSFELVSPSIGGSSKTIITVRNDSGSWNDFVPGKLYKIIASTSLVNGVYQSSTIFPLPDNAIFK